MPRVLLPGTLTLCLPARAHFGCRILEALAVTSWVQSYDSVIHPDPSKNPIGANSVFILGARYDANDAHAVALTKIGWTVSKREGKTVLLSPPSPEMGCLLFRRKIENKIANGEFTAEDAIDMAIPFQRNTRAEPGQRYVSLSEGPREKRRFYLLRV